ncbi:MAG: signal peptidase I [Treponema sp.]|nr:signal peptidase I [Treponema sp.]
MDKNSYDKRRKYSFKEQKKHRHRFVKFILIFLALYILYNCLVTFFISVWVLDNDNMQNGLAAGDRIIFTSFTLPGKITGKSDSLPYKRGSIVLIDMGDTKERNVPLKIVDGIVRFFTAQRISIFSNSIVEQYYIKRVIALPGDEVYMENYVFRVKPAGGSFSLTEFELSEKPYHPMIPQTPALWNESIPFSGSMDPIILGPDECFVVADDRSNTNDSRTWGPVSSSLITATAILRFWPIVKISLL